MTTLQQSCCRDGKQRYGDNDKFDKQDLQVRVHSRRFQKKYICTVPEGGELKITYTSDITILTGYSSRTLYIYIYMYIYIYACLSLLLCDHRGQSSNPVAGCVMRVYKGWAACLTLRPLYKLVLAIFIAGK